MNEIKYRQLHSPKTLYVTTVQTHVNTSSLLDYIVYHKN